jgi:hypothetical protein
VNNLHFSQNFVIFLVPFLIVRLRPGKTKLIFHITKLCIDHVTSANLFIILTTLGQACADRNVSHDWIERTIGNNATKDGSKEKNQQNYCFGNPIR